MCGARGGANSKQDLKIVIHINYKVFEGAEFEFDVIFELG